MMYGAALTQLIIPIALLLWLTRRWRGMQANPGRVAEMSLLRFDLCVS